VKLKKKSFLTLNFCDVNYRTESPISLIIQVHSSLPVTDLHMLHFKNDLGLLNIWTEGVTEVH